MLDRSELTPALADFVDTLALVPDRHDRVQLLISVADRFEPVPQRVARPPYPAAARVPQCESEAYVWAEPRGDGTLDFHFAVENPQGVAAKCFAVVLKDGLSGQPPEAVARVPGDLVYEVFGRELSMGKHLGLLGMLQMTHAYARRALAGAESA